MQSSETTEPLSLNKPFYIDVAHFVRLKKAKIQMEGLYVLHLLMEGIELPPEALNSRDWLRRKQYIDDNQAITDWGKELYASLTGEVTDVLKKAVNKAKPIGGEEKKDSFEAWWNTYPASNYFEHKGKTFKGTQAKRQKKEECRKLFIVLCNSHFRAEDVIRATKFHIDMAKEESVIRRDNQLSFIPNSERYLREKKFEPFISISLKKQETNENGAPENRVISL